MRIKKMKSKELSKLLQDLELQESELIYEAVTRERERIARKMKEQGDTPDRISELTKLDLTEVELLKVNRLKVLIHYELEKEDQKRPNK